MTTKLTLPDTVIVTVRKTLFIFLISSLFLSCNSTQKTNKEDTKEQEEPKGINNIAYRWSEMAIDATANDTEKFKPRPTITSRYLALIFVSIFDAWSRYDDQATPVYLNSVERRPVDERSLSNKEIAISYAAYRAMSEYYYSDTNMFRNFMKELTQPGHLPLSKLGGGNDRLLAHRLVIIHPFQILPHLAVPHRAHGRQIGVDIGSALQSTYFFDQPRLQHSVEPLCNTVA